jgi:hypothetical protein
LLLLLSLLSLDHPTAGAGEGAEQHVTLNWSKFAL